MSRASWVTSFVGLSGDPFSTPRRWGRACGRASEHHLHPRRRPGLRRRAVLEPRGQDRHAEPGPAGRRGDGLHRRAFGLGGLHADALRHPDRPICLAVAAAGGRAGRLQPAADRAGPPDRGRTAPPGRLPDDRRRQVAPRHGLGAAAGQARITDAIEKGADGWNVDFTRPIANGPTAVGFDDYFGHQRPRWTWCRTRSSRTTASP